MKPNSEMAATCARALQAHGDFPEARELCDSWMIHFARTATGDKRWSTIQRVNAWFASNEDFRDTSGFFNTDQPTPERLAWDMLGGDAGAHWAASALTSAGTTAVTPTLFDIDRAENERAVEAAMSDVVTIAGTPAAMRQMLTNTDAEKAAEWVKAIDLSAARRLQDATSVLAGFEGRRPEWEGVLTLEGVTTSDNRQIAEGGLTWRNLPVPLQDQLLSQPGHDGAVAAGPITEVLRSGQEIRGRGFFDSGEDGQNARRRMGEGTKQGVSVDLTEVVIDLPDSEEEILEILFGDGLLVILSARIAAATLVGIPAFEGARLQIVGDLSGIDNPAETLVASGGKLEGQTLTVIMPIETELALVATGGVLNETVEQVTWTEAAENPHATSLEEARANLRESLRHQLEAKRLVALAHISEHEGTAPLEVADTLTASGGKDLRPDKAWFSKRRYAKATPFAIEDADSNGLHRFHGHVGLKGSCHIGFSGKCVPVPMGLDYSSFQGDGVPTEVLCSDGSLVKAGVVVMDTVHPDLRAKASDAYAHYADTGSMVALVRCYEDEWGLQMQGWIMPGTSEEDIVKLRATDISPDWRPRATASGGRGVVALLAVPVSGFNLGLVASGGEIDWSQYEGIDIEDLAIVGTNWTPHMAEYAQRQIAVLTRLGQDVPERITIASTLTEDPALTARKQSVLARLSGEACACDGVCCTS